MTTVKLIRCEAMELPIAGRPERADAARNRARVLDAARELFAERGAANVTMEDVAKRAGKEGCGCGAAA